jgi:glycosyltransferase involved in cell wall biosynthesis
LRQEVEERIRQLSLQKEFILLGWRRDIRKLLAALDVFVLTSLWEGQPICVLESMLAGVAVVVTDTGGVNEVVKDSYTGFLATPHDLQSLAEKTVTLLKDNKLRVCLAKNARDYLGMRFSLEHMVEEHHWLYQRLINN